MLCLVMSRCIRSPSLELMYTRLGRAVARLGDGAMELRSNRCGARTQWSLERCLRAYSSLRKIGAVEEHEYNTWENGGGIVHTSAAVHPSAVVQAGGIVHAGAAVGHSSHVGSGCIVGPNVSVGSSVILRYNVVLQHCTIGDSCLVHAGVCIGQDGFGFTVDDRGEVVKKPQALRVKVGNYVEIGANTCIDRGSWRDTEIGDHTKIDNLVQIGHNVVIGRCCMICGQAGIAGSCTLGDYVVLAGQVGVCDHVKIASKVRVGAKAGVTKDISEPGDYAGFPAVPASLWRKATLGLRDLSASGTTSRRSALHEES